MNAFALPSTHTNMTRFLTTALLLLTLSAPSLAQNRVAPADTLQEQELLELSRTKWLWMAKKQVDSLDALFHAEAVFVHMGGSMSKAQELGVIRSAQFTTNMPRSSSRRFVSLDRQPSY